MKHPAIRPEHRLHEALLAVLIALSIASPATAAALPEGTVLIPAGSYRTPFQRGVRAVEFQVPAFGLAVLPVTNAEFLAFVRARPEWRRSQVDRRFADEAYLRHWAGDLELGEAPPRAPVTQVSWFAARAYAQARGMRLPRLAEWEHAARLTRTDGTEDRRQRELLLDWCSSPLPARLPDVGGSRTNQFGVRDLHGLIWEWTADFDASWAQAAGANPADAFCGAGAGDARNPTDYPMFLRFALRGSLQASHCVSSLGFRCAVSRRAIPL